MSSPTSPNPDSWSLIARYSPDVDLPVCASVDVLVVGAGAAGVAAATVAGEAGLSVALVEKYGFAGGAAVAGMSATICGLYLATNNASSSPQQVVFGFAERFRKELHDRGGLTAPQKYGRTFAPAHDPLKWKEAADELLEGAGVQIYFHTSLTGVIVDGDSVIGAVVESNAGRSVIRARRTIDASGDAAVVARCGFDFNFGQDGDVQNPTMMFRLGGVEVDDFLADYGSDTICSERFSARITAARRLGANLPRQHVWIFESPHPGELLVNATRLNHRSGRSLNVIDPADFTEAEIVGRRQVREYAHFLRENQIGCERSFVVDTGVEAGVRQTRSIAGVETITNADVVGARKRVDGICRSPWPIELHSGDRPRLHWLIDDWCDVPYTSLVPVVGENLIVAGRCLSAEHEALASVRVTAQCFEYGHAAGVATVQSLRLGEPFRSLDVAGVRKAMVSAGSLV
jgi:hypothetical protein